MNIKKQPTHLQLKKLQLLSSTNQSSKMNLNSSFNYSNMNTSSRNRAIKLYNSISTQRNSGGEGGGRITLNALIVKQRNLVSALNTMNYIPLKIHIPNEMQAYFLENGLHLFMTNLVKLIDERGIYPKNQLLYILDSNGNNL